MHHLLFAAPIGDGRELRVSPISLDAFEANKAQTLGDDTGYFIYEFDPEAVDRGIEVLAKAASYDAAMRLIDVIAPALIRSHH
ncbi:hypothetical protein [Roseicella frigidaeris]|uniref:Uncharacterized protein n=1 Tax=Roseicella frigidaeris TaxID=2230885 RepID=A0A327M5L9_9PROT|nr:hypothetical protein [Roseicella frigidaeris]RAI57614.1 hypothetical protein DOO78_17595 [Roseicella frigidaeris]